MFTLCFNNEFICIFISLVFYIFMTNAAKRISQSGTITFFCIVLYINVVQLLMCLKTFYFLWPAKHDDVST